MTGWYIDIGLEKGIFPDEFFDKISIDGLKNEGSCFDKGIDY